MDEIISSVDLLVQVKDLTIIDNRVGIQFLRQKYVLLEHMEQALCAFYYRDLSSFDAHVGENSCQVRACQLLELLDQAQYLGYYHNFIIYRLLVVRQIKENINLAIARINQSVAIRRYQPKQLKARLRRVTLDEFLKINNCVYNLYYFEAFLLHLYILSIYKDGITINFLKMQTECGLSKSAARRLIHRYQSRVSAWTCSFIKRLVASSDKLEHLSNIINKLELFDDDGRKTLPLFLVTEILAQYLLKNGNLVGVIVKRVNNNKTVDYISMYFKPNADGSDFVYIGSDEYCHTDIGCYYIYGNIDYCGAQTVESKISYIIRFNKVGLISVMMADMAIHPQYSGKKNLLYKHNPYGILLNDDFIPNKKSRSILYRFNERLSYATRHGFGAGSKYLLFIKHIKCDFVSNNLQNYQKMKIYWSKKMEISSYINNLELLLALPSNVYWVDSNSVYQGCNHGQAQIFGLKKPEDIVGKSNLELPIFIKNPELATVVDQNNLKVLQSGIIESFEEIYSDPMGEQIACLNKKIPIRDNQNEIVGLVVITLKIEKLKSNSDEIKYSQFQLQNILQYMPGYVSIKDLNGKYIACNNHLTNLLGFQDFKDLLGKTDFDLPTQKDKVTKSKLSDIDFINKGSVTAFQESLRVGESEIDVLTQKIPLFTGNNHAIPIGIMTISIDITETKKLEENIWLLEHIIGSVPGHIWWKDKDLRFLGCNDQQAIDAGFTSKHKIKGKSAYDIIADNQPEEERIKQAKRIDDVDNKILETGNGLTVEESVVLADGSSEVWLSKKDALHDRYGNIIGLIGVSVNISDTKEKERLQLENEIKEKQIEEQKKFKTIVNQVAHDMTSPLVTLGMMLSTDDFKELPHRSRDFLNNMISKIRGIANHLLSQYRIENGNSNSKVQILLHDLLTQVYTIKAYQYKRIRQVNLEYFVDKAAMETFVNIDHNLFSRMMLNLIENSFQSLIDRKGFIKVKLEVKNQVIDVSVADNGCGIPKDVIDKLLNSENGITFGKIGGHGIGFSQIKETIYNNGGKLKIDSKQGVGTTITASFPITLTPDWFSDTINLNGNDIIVILDDNSMIHSAWDMILEPILENNQKIEVKHFFTDADTIEYINSLKKEDHQNVFLLTDYELAYQECNGLDVIKQTNVTNALLLTDKYTDITLQKLVAESKAKMLPKSLAPIVKFNVTQAQKVQVVLVDDDKEFVKSFIEAKLKGKIVDKYYNLSSFINQSFQYSKDVIILMDNYFNDDTELEGKNIAEELYKSGFKNLYLLSIGSFDKEKLPEYLIPVCKNDEVGMREFSKYIETIH